MSQAPLLDEIDRRIMLATQEGLPITARPFAAVAETVGIPAEEVIERFRRMQDLGIVRRVAAVPNHYKLGYTANGMTVWEVPLEVIDQAGQRLAALEYVSHCYRRPAKPPVWPYTLFAMVHAKDRAEVEARVAEMAELLRGLARSHQVLYSTKILKKTGLRIQG
ncbi:MAG TPA: AsnC family transcriptional regulator [Azospirillum sp.]|nr:AsnC family transcriptional regulator [Azospirillum sp.]